MSKGCDEGKAVDTLSRVALGKFAWGRGEIKCRLLFRWEEETVVETDCDYKKLESTVRAEVASRRTTNRGWCVNTN